MADDVLKFRAGELRTAVMDQAAESDITVSDWLRDAVTEKLAKGCNECGTCDVCGLDQLTVADLEVTDTQTATIMATAGGFDDTSNPDVQALIDRARELLAIGAVGVSVALDADPADMPDPNSETDPEAIWDAMQNAHTRIRHVAIVDTPAFSGAYLTIDADGNLSGPVVFEGLPTGDGRGIAFENITLDESILPIPIIFDLAEGDHTGTTIGHIGGLERVAGIVGGDTAPLAASVTAYPAGLFAEPAAQPLEFEDIGGFTRMFGALASNGCHKASGRCGTYRGADLTYFHSGARIPLDDGTFIRVGRIVAGGVHADASKLDYTEALARTDDSRRIVAMGRAFDTPKGLLFSGVVLPDVDVMRLQAAAPSIELWPNARGKLELKTALMVNEPALPFAASTTDGHSITLMEAAPDEPDPDLSVVERLERLEATTAELLSAHMTAQLDA